MTTITLEDLAKQTAEELAKTYHCPVCGKLIAKNNAHQVQLYCSKKCRKQRHKKTQ